MPKATPIITYGTRPVVWVEAKAWVDHTMRLSFALLMQRKIHCEAVLRENTQIKSENVEALQEGVGSSYTPVCRICITINI